MAALLVGYLLWPEANSTDPFSGTDAERPAEQAHDVFEPEPASIQREAVEAGTAVLPDAESGPPGRKYIPRTSPAALTGRVVDEEGQPRAGAAVSAFLLAHRHATEGHVLAGGHTHADGSFRLTGFEPGLAYLVRAEDEDCQPATSDPAEPEPGQTLDLGELVLMTTCGVSGRVVDAQENPIAGATVGRYAARDAKRSITDALGRFSLEGVPPGKVFIGAGAPGFVSSLANLVRPNTGLVSLELRPGEVRDDLVIVLEREGTIRGRIVAPDGSRQAEELFRITARVGEGKVSGAFTSAAGETVADGGEFVLDGLDPDLSYDLIATGLSGRRSTRQNVPCGVRDLTFQFPVLPVIQVAVRSGEDGTPLLPDRILVRREGVLACNYSPTAWGHRREDSPPPLLRLPYEKAGAHEMIVSRRGYLDFHFGPEPLDGRSSLGPITAVLRTQPPAPPTISGVVLRADTREPLANVMVSRPKRFLGEGFARGTMHGVLVEGLAAFPDPPFARTDEQGRFSFDSGRAPLSLELKDARYSAPRLDLPRGSSLMNLEILAYEQGAVEGRVLQVNGGAGAGLPVVAHRSDAAPRGTTTGGNGEYRIAPLLPGRWSISVGNPYAKEKRSFGHSDSETSGEHNATISVVIPEGHFATADIDLRQLAAALEGTVTVNKLPRTSHSVTLTPAGADPKNALMTYEAWTGSSGEYGFPALPPGRYRAAVRSSRGRTVLGEADLSLARGHALRHDFDIQLGKLRVTVLAQESGEPIESAQVSAFPVSGPDKDIWLSPRVLARTDSEGLALLYGLTAGEFFVVIDSDRGAVGRRVTLPPAGTGTLTVRLPEPATLRVTLEAAGIETCTFLQLDLLVDGQRVSSRQILGPLAEPTLELTNLQPATYDLRARLFPLHLTASSRVEVLPGVENAVTLAFEQVEPPGEDG